MRDSEDDNEALKAIRNWVDRRQFGRILVGSVGALAMGRFANGAGPPPGCEIHPADDLACPRPAGTYEPGMYPDMMHFTGTHSTDVVVVGAGLSGLIAARELKKAGKRVIVLEARRRIGGRMEGRPTQGTARPGYLDYGGQWVGKTQYHMQELVAELNITPFDSYEEGRAIQSWNGTKTGFNGDVSDLLKGCTPQSADQLPPFPERHGDKCQTPGFADCPVYPKDQLKPNGKVWNELLKLSEKLKPYRDRPWASPDATDWDSQTFKCWLERQGAHDGDYMKWLSTMQSRIGGPGGFEPDQVSLLHMAWTQQVGPQAETPEKWLLFGGAGQIPERLANEFIADNRSDDPDHVIVLDAAVSRIENNDFNGGSLVIVKSGLTKILTVFARQVIIAIPPSLRNRITFEPALPPDYNAFGTGSRMGSMSKVHVVYDKAFWRDDCLSGTAAGNIGRKEADRFGTPDGKLKVCEFIADSSPPNGMPGVLTTFIAGDINKLYPDEAAVMPRVYDDFVYFFGEKAGAKYARDHVYRNWNDEAWSCGAFTNFLGPGVWTSSAKVGWRTPVKSRIFWAGTETSDEWPGYFDGAVKAGKRAAREVLATS